MSSLHFGVGRFLERGALSRVVFSTLRPMYSQYLRSAEPYTFPPSSVRQGDVRHLHLTSIMLELVPPERSGRIATPGRERCGYTGILISCEVGWRPHVDVRRLFGPCCPLARLTRLNRGHAPLSCLRWVESGVVDGRGGVE